MVKKTINALACALIASLAFAQTSTATTETVTTYEPGKVIVIGSESGHDTFSYVILNKTLRYVNKAGRPIDAQLIKPGTRVHVYYDGTGATRVVDQVVVDQD